MLQRNGNPRVLDGFVEAIMRDSNHQLVKLRVTREALRDYYGSRGLTSSGSPLDMFLGAAYNEIVKVANRLYDRHQGVKPSQVVVTTRMLND